MVKTSRNVCGIVKRHALITTRGPLSIHSGIADLLITHLLADEKSVCIQHAARLFQQLSVIHNLQVTFVARMAENGNCHSSFKQTEQ